METLNIIFTYHLFEDSELLDAEYSKYLIEEYLFSNSIISINKKFIFIGVQ